MDYVDQLRVQGGEGRSAVEFIVSAQQPSYHHCAHKMSTNNTKTVDVTLPNIYHGDLPWGRSCHSQLTKHRIQPYLILIAIMDTFNSLLSAKNVIKTVEMHTSGEACFWAVQMLPCSDLHLLAHANHHLRLPTSLRDHPPRKATLRKGAPR